MRDHPGFISNSAGGTGKLRQRIAVPDLDPGKTHGGYFVKIQQRHCIHLTQLCLRSEVGFLDFSHENCRAWFRMRLPHHTIRSESQQVSRNVGKELTLHTAVITLRGADLVQSAAEA